MAVNEKWFRVTEEDILKANIKKYDDDNIIKYYTEKADPKYTYLEYQVVFEAVMEALSSRLGRNLRTVDVCGGAGKAAFIMKRIDPSSEVSLVDLSEKMLAVAREKMVTEGVGEVKIVKADAFSFLEETDQQYDLIVFSSAIHHFKDPIKLLAAASKRLTKQGFIIAIAEPTTIIKTTRFKIATFIFGHKEYKYDVVKGWVKNILSPVEPGEEFVDIAEYHTYMGIDDEALSCQLSSAGLYSLIHMRYPAGDPFMLKVMPYIGLNWSFGLILRKGQHQDDVQMTSEIEDKIKAGLPFKVSIL